MPRSYAMKVKNNKLDIGVVEIANVEEVLDSIQTRKRTSNVLILNIPPNR